MNRCPNNFQTVTDQCIFCSKTTVPGSQGEDSAKTPPRWLTNSGCIAQAFSVWCGGAHKHQQLVGTEKSVAEDSMLHAPGMYLTILKEMCVNAATERTHVKARMMSRGQNCPRERDSVFVGQKRARVCNWSRSTGANGTQPSWPQMDRYQQEHH